jgi:hypothetical protein
MAAVVWPHLTRRWLNLLLQEQMTAVVPLWPASVNRPRNCSVEMAPVRSMPERGFNWMFARSLQI